MDWYRDGQVTSFPTQNNSGRGDDRMGFSVGRGHWCVTATGALTVPKI